MATTITAGNATNGLALTSDNTGTLQIKTGTGSGTTALTLDASQNATLAGTLGVGAITSTGLVTSATGALYPLVSGTAVASTSGTSIDFTGIPSTAKRITVMLNGVSLNSGSVLRFRLGTGGTPTTSGYLGTAVNPAGSPASQSFTAGFDMYGALTAATAAYGAIVFTLIGSNAWAGSGNIGTSSPGFNSIAGTVSLSGTLDFVRITTVNGTDTFDAGTINIMWE